MDSIKYKKLIGGIYIKEFIVRNFFNLLIDVFLRIWLWKRSIFLR